MYLIRVNSCSFVAEPCRVQWNYAAAALVVGSEGNNNRWPPSIFNSHFPELARGWFYANAAARPALRSEAPAEAARVHRRRRCRAGPRHRRDDLYVQHRRCVSAEAAALSGREPAGNAARAGSETGLFLEQRRPGEFPGLEESECF